MSSQGCCRVPGCSSPLAERPPELLRDLDLPMCSEHLRHLEQTSARPRQEARLLGLDMEPLILRRMAAVLLFPQTNLPHLTLLEGGRS